MNDEPIQLDFVKLIIGDYALAAAVLRERLRKAEEHIAVLEAEEAVKPPAKAKVTIDQDTDLR